LLCYDINPEAIKLTEKLLDFEIPSPSKERARVRVLEHDARKKNKDLKDVSIDFVLMHPPYADIIKYSD
jgi:tRNA1(Val) A37 N6-methylase TrmN6